MIFSRKAAFITTAIIAIVVILAVSFLDRPHRHKFPEDIRVGVILNLTGTSAKVDGPKKQTMEVALEYLSRDAKNRHIQLVFEDGKSTAKDSVAAFRALQAQGIQHFLAGSSLSAMPIAPLVKASNALVFGVSGHPDFTREAGLGIRCYPEVVESARIIADHVSKRALKKILILHMEEPWTESYAQQLRKSLSSTQINVEKYPVGNQDFRSIASNAKIQKPDSVILLDFGVSMQAIVKSFIELEVKCSFVGCETSYSAQLQNVKGFDELDFVFLATESTVRTAEGRDAFSRYFIEKTSSSPPPYYAVMCADALAILAKTSQSATDDAAATYSQLIAMPDFDAFSGRIKVQANGDVKYGLKLYRYSGSDLQEVK